MDKKNIPQEDTTFNPEWIKSLSNEEARESLVCAHNASSKAIAEHTRDGIWKVYLVEKRLATYKIKFASYIVLYSDGHMPRRFSRWLIKKYLGIEFEIIS